MTPIADMVAEMIARGVAADIIVLAVKAAEQAASCGKSGGIPVDETAERRRAYDRERKAAKRKSGGIPVESPRTSDPALTVSSPTKETDLPKEVKKVKARKHPLSADWQPNDGHFDAATKLGKPRQFVLDKAEDMRIWAKSSGEMKADWDATLHGFMRRDAPKYHAGNGAAPRPGSKEDTRERTVQTLRSLKAFAESDDQAGSREADPPVSGLLPFAKPA